MDGSSSCPKGTPARRGGRRRCSSSTSTGKFIKTWGKWGSGDGEFDQPHALAIDSRGRLFIGDRNNNRVQIFDQDGKFMDSWYQFSRPSGIYIDKNDNLYVADSESMSVSRNHQDWKRGIRIGSLKDGRSQLSSPIPTRMPPARAQPKASSSTRWGMCTAQKSDRERSRSTRRSKARTESGNWVIW